MDKIIVYINGLRRSQIGKKGALVGLFDINKEKTEEGRQILAKEADTEGIVYEYISNSYIGKDLKLVIRDLGFKFIETNVKVERFGLIYTAKQDRDHIIDKKHIEKQNGDYETIRNWNSEEEFTKALILGQKIVRTLRKKNKFFSIINYTVSISAILLGLIIHPILSVVLGFVAFFTSNLLTPKILGIDKDKNIEKMSL